MDFALPEAAAQNYPLLNAFLTMLFFFLWILWIFLVIWVFMDIFRSYDLSGWAKAGWTIFVVILPYIGVLVYLGVRGSGMMRRDRPRPAAAEGAHSHVQPAGTGTSASAAEEVSKLAALRDQGVLTDEEFTRQKAKVLG